MPKSARGERETHSGPPKVDAEARRLARRRPPPARDCGPVSEDLRSRGADEKRSPVPDAGCGAVLRHRQLDAGFELANALPVTDELLHLHDAGDSVDAVMRRQARDELVVLRRKPARFSNPTDGDGRSDRRDVHVVDVVRVGDLADEVEATHLGVVRRFELALSECRGAASIPGVRTQLRVAQSLCQAARFRTSFLVQPPHRPRDQRSHVRSGYPPPHRRSPASSIPLRARAADGSGTCRSDWPSGMQGVRMSPRVPAARR